MGQSKAAEDNNAFSYVPALPVSMTAGGLAAKACEALARSSGDQAQLRATLGSLQSVLADCPAVEELPPTQLGCAAALCAACCCHTDHGRATDAEISKLYHTSAALRPLIAIVGAFVAAHNALPASEEGTVANDESTSRAAKRTAALRAAESALECLSLLLRRSRACESAQVCKHLCLRRSLPLVALGALVTCSVAAQVIDLCQLLLAVLSLPYEVRTSVCVLLRVSACFCCGLSKLRISCAAAVPRGSASARRQAAHRGGGNGPGRAGAASA